MAAERTKKRRRDVLPLSVATGRPAAPQWLSDDASIVFSEVCDWLETMGTLTLHDAHEIERYAVAKAEHRALTQHIAEHGAVQETETRSGVFRSQSAEAKRQLALGRELKDLADRLGLHPRSRAAMPKKIETSPAAFLMRKRS